MIFSSIKIGSLEVSNRIVVAPMCQYSAINGVMTDWHTQHLMQLGYSAAGLIMVEATAVEKIGRITHNCVGIYDNKIVAYGSVVVENKVRGEVAGHIEDIVVDTEVRGKMIGVSLIKELVKVAKRKGCYRITLFCKESLINFYSRNGFEVNNVVMKKYL